MQQYGSKYFARRHPHSGDGVNRSKFIFLEHGHVTYQIKENHKYSNMVVKICTKIPPVSGDWVCRSNSTSTEDSHIAYKIKENHKCSNMVVNILPAVTPTRGMGSLRQIQLFQNMVMLNIKLKKITNAQHGSKYFARRPPAPMTLGYGVKRSKFIFFRTWSCCISN